MKKEENKFDLSMQKEKKLRHKIKQRQLSKSIENGVQGLMRGFNLKSL
jgi:hypothetical protein